MKIGYLRNILLVTLFILASIHLVKTTDKINAATVAKAKDASKVANSLKDASSKASKFSAILNSGLTKFSTYVYGVTATMAVIDFIWPGVIPEADPAYVAEMRAYFEVLKDEFRVLKNQVNDLKLYVQERSTNQIYADHIVSIHTTETYFEEYMDSTAALREAYAKSFIDNYDQVANHADKLYTGLTISDDNLNIGKNAISYTKGDRTKILEIMMELFNVINMGIRHEALYYQLKDEPLQIDVLNSRWETRMNNLQRMMKEIDDEVVAGAKDQIEVDFDENISDLKDKDNSVMANNLYTFFSEKYYWKDWVVIVYPKSVVGHENHAYAYCRDNAVFRKRLANFVDKTIYMFHVDKATGSWMTKSVAKSKLTAGPYTNTGWCYRYEGRSRSRYECQKPTTDLSKVIDTVKPKLRVCGITKGIVIIKDGDYGIAGDDRIKVHKKKSDFNAFAIGPYGSSSPQESVEGYSINGGWTPFTDYTRCSKTCGGGTQRRTRYCRSPLPQDGGRTCSGSGTQTRSCNTFSCFSKTFLTNKIENIMLMKKGKNNEDFAEYLRDQLRTSYPEYRFSVNAYNSISGSDKHSYQGYSLVTIKRKYGRNVVVGYTKKSKSVPNSSKLKEIEARIVAAITNKKKEAKKSRELAWNELKKEGYRVAMVLVVRFGNGLRSRSTGGGIFFENFNAKGSHKSSLVVMLGKA